MSANCLEGAQDEIQHQSMALPPQNRNNIGRDIFSKMAGTEHNFYGTRSAHDEIDTLSATKPATQRPQSQLGGLTGVKQRTASPGSRYQRPQ